MLSSRQARRVAAPLARGFIQAATAPRGARSRGLASARNFILPFEGNSPTIHDSAFIAPSASIIGNVSIGEKSSVWYNCALRGDVNNLTIGKRSNIQDGTVIHVRSAELGGGKPNPTIIGNDVTIGHSALIHACTLEDMSFVGMQAVVMDFAVVESMAMVGAGSLVLANKRIPSGQLWAGRPAKYIRDLTDAEMAFLKESAEKYAEFGQRHKRSQEGGL